MSTHPIPSVNRHAAELALLSLHEQRATLAKFDGGIRMNEPFGSLRRRTEGESLRAQWLLCLFAPRSEIVGEATSSVNDGRTTPSSPPRLIFVSYRRRAYFSARCVVANERAHSPVLASLPRPPPAPASRPPSPAAHSDFPILMTQISFIRSLFANYGRKEGRDKGRAMEGKGRRVQRAERGGGLGQDATG